MTDERAFGPVDKPASVQYQLAIGTHQIDWIVRTSPFASAPIV
jgi:hypothetical protein